MQGVHEADGLSYRCRPCRRTERSVHDTLGVPSYSVTTKRFERLSADFFLDKGAPTAVRRLKEHHGIEPGRTTVLNHVEAHDLPSVRHRTPSSSAMRSSDPVPVPLRRYYGPHLRLCGHGHGAKRR